MARQIMAAVREVDLENPLGAAAGSQVGLMVRQAVKQARAGHDPELMAVIEQVIEKVIDGLRFVDPTPEQARETLKGLFERGLLRPGPGWRDPGEPEQEPDAAGDA
jgi:hypothetical protein